MIINKTYGKITATSTFEDYGIEKISYPADFYAPFKEEERVPPNYFCNLTTPALLILNHPYFSARLLQVLTFPIIDENKFYYNWDIDRQGSFYKLLKEVDGNEEEEEHRLLVNYRNHMNSTSNNNSTIDMSENNLNVLAVEDVNYPLLKVIRGNWTLFSAFLPIFRFYKSLQGLNQNTIEYFKQVCNFTDLDDNNVGFNYQFQPFFMKMFKMWKLLFVSETAMVKPYDYFDRIYRKVEKKQLERQKLLEQARAHQLHMLALKRQRELDELVRLRAQKEAEQIARLKVVEGLLQEKRRKEEQQAAREQAAREIADRQRMQMLQMPTAFPFNEQLMTPFLPQTVAQLAEKATGNVSHMNQTIPNHFTTFSGPPLLSLPQPAALPGGQTTVLPGKKKKVQHSMIQSVPVTAASTVPGNAKQPQLQSIPTHLLMASVIATNNMNNPTAVQSSSSSFPSKNVPPGKYQFLIFYFSLVNIVFYPS
jgi:hypothetical protein